MDEWRKPGPKRRKGAGSQAEQISVLVVGDHPVVRFGVCHLLDLEPDLKVVGAAASGAETLKIQASLQPRVVLLDLETDGGYCFNLISKMVASGDIRIVVYTGRNDECSILKAVHSGASGYVIKASDPAHLLNSIRAVAGGGSYLDPAIASKVIGRLRRCNERRAPNSRELTQRESDVLCRLASGKRNKEIAEELFISERTVKFHIKAMFTKLRAKNRTQAVVIAAEQGLINS
jgi:DNA-binding NarL/FixJ family response regulator